MPQACNSTANSRSPLLRASISGQPTPPTFLFRFQLQTPLLATLLLSFAFGCASPGPPRPPSLKLPELVTDLTAQRVGNQVLLQWTTPTKTTDNLAIKGALTARICRTPVSAQTTQPPTTQNPTPTNQQATKTLQPATPCPGVLTVPIHTGASTAADTLPPSLTSDPVTLLDYRVEINNSNGRTAGPSNPAYAVAGSAPPPVAALRATAIETGVMLEWTPPTPATPTYVELDRVDLTLAATRQLQAQTKSGPPQPLQTTGKETPEVHLRAKATQPTTTDQKPTTGTRQTTTNQPPTSAPESSGTTPEPSGTIDQTAHFGDLYRYTAQRVRSITLGGHSLDLRSVISAPITIPLRDTFPPATPTGLYAVPGQTTATTTNQQPAPNQQTPTNNQQLTTNNLAIDLSWQPNSEPDLAGYIVYRHQLPAPNSTAPTRLTPTPLPGPAYRDITAIPGQTYAYSVTAIDTSGNESKPSPEVQETLPQP
jgi:hypothetical protein